MQLIDDSCLQPLQVGPRMDLELDSRAATSDDTLLQQALKKDRKPVENKVHLHISDSVICNFG